MKLEEGHLLPLASEEEPLDSDDLQKAKEAKRNGHLKARESIRIAGLKQLMSTRDGRAWMWSVLELCGPYRNAFTGNSTTFFQCGQQSIGQQLIADCRRHCKESYRLMENESEVDFRG